MNQDEILPLIYKKDDIAFHLLFDRYAKSLFGVIFNIINNQEEAEEVLVETFLKIWNTLDSFQENEDRFYTWMLNIAREKAVQKLESKEHFELKVNKLKPNFVHTLDSKSETSNPIEAIGINEFVKKLKPKHIQIIDLLFFKKSTLNEARESLEIPLEEVKKQTRDCLTELRNLLKT
jgi:RNA polymerase sigma-70 factor (ECF subfamily)